MGQLFRCASALTIAVSTLLVTACAERWTKPGASPQDFDAAQAACTSSATTLVPRQRQEVQTSPGYFMPMQTRCSGVGPTSNCYAGGGQYVAPATMTVDRNQGLRRAAVRACLQDNGWQPVK